MSENYWELLRNMDHREMFQIVQNMKESDPNGIRLNSWLEANKDEFYEYYLQGIKDKVDEALLTSFHTFGLYIYIIKNKEKFEPKPKVELKPQSLKLQKELEDLYKDKNIQKEIDDLLGDIDND